MKERPIIFSGESVRAILAGTKTQTRRLVKARPPAGASVGDIEAHPDYPDEWFWWLNGDERSTSFLCPYGARGDRLWVRESWRTSKKLDGQNAKQIAALCDEADYSAPWAPVLYADGARDNWDSSIWGEAGRPRSARYMPRWASRLTLELCEVRVERLQDISEDDARAEGVVPMRLQSFYLGIRPRTVSQLVECTHREAFETGWDALNGKRAPWASNPFVWVLTFKRLGAA